MPPSAVVALEPPAVAPPRTAARRLGLFLTLGAAAIYGPMTMDINLPALPAIANDLGTSVPATQLTMTSYLVGLAAGQVVWGATSDTFGRRRPFFAGLTLYIVASFACGLAPSIAALIALRLLQGLGSAGIVMTRAVVRDVYGAEQSAAYFSRLLLVVGLAPVVAPSIGAQILTVTSWRGIFAVLGLFGIAILALTWVTIPETLPPALRRPARVRAMAGDFGALLRQREFAGLIVAAGLTSAVTIAMITGSTFALQNGFGLSARQFGAIYALGALLMISVAQLNAALLPHVRPRTSVIACVCINGGAELALAVLGGRYGAAPLCIALILAIGTWGLITSNVTALALAEHGHVAGTAAALVGVAQFGAAAVIAPLSGLAGASAGAIGVVAAICSAGALASLLLLTRSPT